MTPADLKFPAIDLKDGYVGAHLSSQWLAKWYLGGIEGGHFEALKLISVDGTCYQVTSVQLGPVALWQRLINPLWGQVVPVRLGLTTAQAPTIDELKALMLTCVRSPTWSSRDDVEETIEAIHASGSIPALVDAYVRASFRAELPSEAT